MKTSVFIFILGLSLFLRVFLLDVESLWLDEGSSVKFAKLSVAEIVKSTQTDAHPPLYYLIICDSFVHRVLLSRFNWV